MSILSRSATLDDGQIYEQIFAGGEWRTLNLVPSDKKKMSFVTIGRDIMAPSDLHDFEDPIPNLKIKNQSNVGACNGHAAARTVEFIREMQGMPYIPISAWWIYGNLTGGWDTGSNIGDALRLISDKGASPESLNPYKMYNPKKFTAEANAAASRFKIDISNTCTSFDQVLTAVALRQPLNVSITAGARFSDLDGEGVPPVGWGFNNHAVFVGGGIKTSKKWGKLVKMANSWDDIWGLNGFCWLAEAHLFGGGFECYELNAAFYDPQDTLPTVLA